MRVPTEANDHAAEAEAGEQGDAGAGGGRHRIGRVRAFPRGEENSHATISTIARRRKISNNTKACPASEDAPLPVSGVGVALLGATGVNVAGNVITGNVPSAESDLSGGVIVAKGVFNGVGRIVEIPNLPTDPDNVSRDDLVFADGSIRIVSTLVDFSVSGGNGQSCHFNATVQQTVEVVGGTGRFSAASGTFAATGSGPVLLARNPDGSCSFEQDPLREVDMISMSGTLSF